MRFKTDSTVGLCFAFGALVHDTNIEVMRIIVAVKFSLVFMMSFALLSNPSPSLTAWAEDPGTSSYK